MSNELTIATENGQTMAELMGINTQADSGPSLARLSQIQSPIKGEVEMGGKKMKVDVHDVGTFALRISEDQTVYADSVTVRVFLQREQWTRWNSETKTMEKSVLANDVRNDLHDNLGGFNLGRPSGYIQDWDALPDATKDIVRSVKRTRVVMGLVTLNNPKAVDGTELSEGFVELPFIYDLKNNNSFKALDGAFKSLARKNTLPLCGNIVLTPELATLANGNQFAFIKAAVDGTVDVDAGDSDTLQNFVDVVKYVNTGIMDKYHEGKDKGLDAEEAALVGSIVDVEE